MYGSQAPLKDTKGIGHVKAAFLFRIGSGTSHNFLVDMHRPALNYSTWLMSPLAPTVSKRPTASKHLQPALSIAKFRNLVALSNVQSLPHNILRKTRCS